MNHTFWQIDKLRKALNQYRGISVVNGNLPSWTEVAEDIMACMEIFVAEKIKLSPEVLRRFAADQSVAKGDVLNALRQFLIHEKLLNASDFKNETEVVGEMEFALNYLGNDTTSALKQINQLNGRYRAALRVTKRDIEVRLDITPHGTRPFFYVEERTTKTDNYKGLYEEPDKDKHQSHDLRRKGYGFVSTASNRIHMFLRGASRADAVSYIEPEYVVYRQQASNTDQLLLILVGEDGTYVDLRPELPNLRFHYLFSPSP